MAKKKKKSKKSISILNEVDKVIEGTYSNIREEIEDIQLKLNIAEQKAKKAAKKIAKKKRASKKDFYDANELRTKVRKEIIEESFEKKGLLDRITSTLQDMGPIVVIIARLIASLISCILSIDIVKVMVKPETLKKMDTVYKKAMAVM